MKGSQILSEAYAGPSAIGLIEIGTTTHERYRGRGYATLTCAHLVEACEALGFQTYWNCAKHNLASAAIARKLGYCVEREYKLVAWFKRD
jgi:RimJ/RimL family protein N-acetyltransferase